MNLKNILRLCVATSLAATTAARADINADAMSIGLDFIQHQILKCDNQYFIKYQWGISNGSGVWLQLLDPKAALLTGQPPTDVDRLNGLEWRGGMKLAFRAFRALQETPPPSCGGSDCAAFNETHRNDRPTFSWDNWTTRDSGITIIFSKINGKWINQPSPDGFFVRPGTCSDIPLMPPKVNLPPATTQSPARTKPAAAFPGRI